MSSLIASSSSSAASAVGVAPCNLRLLLFGGSGRTGQLLIEQALQRGHCVTALVRNPDKLKALSAALSAEKKGRLQLTSGSVTNSDDIDKAIRSGFAGQPFDAVVSTLSSDEKPHTACSTSTQHVLESARKQQEQLNSAAGASSSSSIGGTSPFRYLVTGGMIEKNFMQSRPWYERMITTPLMAIWGKSANDRYKEMDMLTEAQKANPHWRLLMVAPPFLTNGPITGKYSTDSHNPGMHIWSAVSRNDVAHYILRLVEENDEQIKAHVEGLYAPIYNP